MLGMMLRDAGLWGVSDKDRTPLLKSTSVRCANWEFSRCVEKSRHRAPNAVGEAIKNRGGGGV